jgi:hypothetical protein
LGNTPFRVSSRRTARAILGGGFPSRTLSVCAAGSQFPMIAVSVQPSSHPGRSDFPSPVGGDSFSQCPFRTRDRFKRSLAYTRPLLRYKHRFVPRFALSVLPGFESGHGAARQPLPTESPFARSRRYRFRSALKAQVGGRYPAFFALTGLCVKPPFSRRLRSSLFLQVFAGCRKSLLHGGLSRRYLCDPCEVACIRTPPRHRGVLVRFIPQHIGLAIGSSSSARETIPQRSFTRGEISGL